MKKETILAIILTIAVWVVWFAFFVPEPQQQGEQQYQTEQHPEQTQDEQSPKQTPVIGTVEVVKQNVIKPDAVPEISFNTERFTGSLSPLGASISQLDIKGLKEENVSAVIPMEELRTKGWFDFAVHFNAGDFLNGSELENSVWNVMSSNENETIFAINARVSGQPLLIQKKFSFTSEGDSFNVEYSFINRGGEDVQASTLIFSPGDMLGPKLDYENRYNLVQGISGVNGSYEAMPKGGSERMSKEVGSIDWAGIASRYILLIMMPNEESGYEAVTDNREGRGFRTGVAQSVGLIRAGATVKKSFTVYLGPKDKDRLAAVDPKLKNAADISTIIEPIRYFVVWALLKINGFVGNMGWALVIFSVLTKLAFTPLTNKSTASMKKMQELSPKINALKEKYKAKPDVMQREIMTLYKENKVNPMSGCLPILVQMPFFFALYSALIDSVDLWNAPFILWMKDLSMPDTLFTVGGFNFNVLPLLMTGSTFVQQKLSTVDTGQSKGQKMMIMLMPLIFIFIFWTIPSGLVLYWTLQNVFQIANQLIVNKLGKEKTAAA